MMLNGRVSKGNKKRAGLKKRREDKTRLDCWREEEREQLMKNIGQVFASLLNA